MSKRKVGLPEGQAECSRCKESFTPGFVEAVYTNTEGDVCYYCLDCIDTIAEDGYNYPQKIINILDGRLTKEDCSIMLKILIRHPSIISEISGMLRLIIQRKEKV